MTTIRVSSPMANMSPELKALYAEHCASPRGLQYPQEVAAAKKARTDLLDRVKGKAWKWSRDDRRLMARYERVVEQWEAGLVEKHFGAATDNPNGATS